MQIVFLAGIDCQSAPDDALRDGIADWRAPCGSETIELTRAERLQSDATPRSAAFDEHNDGQGRQRRAGAEPVNADPRGHLLRELSDDIRRWNMPDKRSTRLPPRDDLLEDLLRGRWCLAQTAPVSDLFLPILWFAPFIDHHLLGWIGQGAPVAPDTDGAAAAIAAELSRVHAWGAALYASPFVAGRDDRIACHLFTGVSPVTSDFGHAWQ